MSLRDAPPQTLRVLFIQRRANKAGVQVCLQRTVAALKEAGVDVQVLMGEEGWLSNELNSLKALAGIVPFPSLRSPLSRWLKWRGFLKQAEHIRQNHPSFQLINAADTWDALIAEGLSRRWGLPWMVHLRSILTPENPSGHYYKYHCHRADAVAAVSDRVYRSAREWEHAILEYIPEGMAEKEFRSPHETRRTFPERVGVIGHGGEIKGWTDLAAAFRDISLTGGRLPRKIIFMGSVEGAKAEELRKELPGGIEVMFTGHVEDLASRAVECDMVIAPSRSESFGLAMMEVIAAGIPLLASDTGIVSRIMGRGSPWIFSPGEPDSIVAAWTRLPSLWQNHRSAVETWQQRLKEEFLISHTTEKLIRLYRRIIEKA